MTVLSEQGDPAILTEALPDLIVGLVGIPVAFAMQSIVDSLARRDQLVSGESFRLVGFLVALYAIYSVTVFLIFQAGLRDPVLKLGWQTHFVRLVAPIALSTLVFIGGVMGFGEAYALCKADLRISMARLCVLALVSAMLPLTYYPRVLSFLWNRYRTLMKFGSITFLVTASFLLLEIMSDLSNHP